jgi:hypothetical protein
MAMRSKETWYLWPPLSSAVRTCSLPTLAHAQDGAGYEQGTQVQAITTCERGGRALKAQLSGGGEGGVREDRTRETGRERARARERKRERAP